MNKNLYTVVKNSLNVGQFSNYWGQCWNKSVFGSSLELKTVASYDKSVFTVTDKGVCTSPDKHFKKDKLLLLLSTWGNAS